MNETTETKKEFKRKPYYNLYHPSQKESSGAAMQFSYDAYNKSVFIDATRQQGEKLEMGSKEQFNWQDKVTMKVGIPDIGKMLLLFSGRDEEIECIHSSKDIGRTSVLEMKQKIFKDKLTFEVGLKVTKEGSTRGVTIYLSREEMALLAKFMTASLDRMFGFEYK